DDLVTGVQTCALPILRFLGNRSSGKMGYALAEAALRRGARVILVSGPVALEAPTGAEIARVESAEEMRRAVLARSAEATMIIKEIGRASCRERGELAV